MCLMPAHQNMKNHRCSYFHKNKEAGSQRIINKALDEMLSILAIFHHRRLPSTASKDKDDEKTITTHDTAEEHNYTLIQHAYSTTPLASILKKMTPLPTSHAYPSYGSKSSFRRGKRESNSDDALNTTYQTS